MSQHPAPEDDDVNVFLPPLAKGEDLLDFSLVTLTEAISKINAESVAHGALGGEFGYGAHWDDAVFSMRPYYWGDCDCGAEERESAWSAVNKHAADCYQTVLHRERVKAGLEPFMFHSGSWDQFNKREDEIYFALTAKFGLPIAGCAVHCTCGHQEAFMRWQEMNGHRETCALMLPNFHHKPSGFQVRWYKWIGRGMEVSNPQNVDVASILRECVAVIAARTLPESARTADGDERTNSASDITQ